jgi:hypothetical protein
MSTTPTPKLLAPGEGKTVMLFGVRFDYKTPAPAPLTTPAG